MKMISIAAPGKRIASRPQGKKLVVPNMSMSLQEILERFTRGESLEIGRDPVFDEEGDVDLEKMKVADLVDRAEFVEKLKATQKQFDKEEKERRKAHQAALDKLAVEKIAADKLAAQKAAEENSKGKP